MRRTSARTAVTAPAKRREGSRSGPAAALARDAAAFHDALTDLVRIYQFRDRDRICCHDVSVTQCYAVDDLIRRGPLSLNALAAEMYLDKSTASRVVATLVRKGYVARSSDPGDGRAVLLQATAKGKRLHDRIRSELIRLQSRLLADLPREMRRSAIRLLRRLAQATMIRIGAGGVEGRGGKAALAP